jgi:hypothetical protein
MSQLHHYSSEAHHNLCSTKLINNCFWKGLCCFCYKCFRCTSPWATLGKNLISMYPELSFLISQSTYKLPTEENCQFSQIGYTTMRQTVKLSWQHKGEVQTEFATAASNEVPRHSYVRRKPLELPITLPLLQSALPPHEQERKPLCDYKKEGRRKHFNPTCTICQTLSHHELHHHFHEMQHDTRLKLHHQLTTTGQYTFVMENKS